MNLKSSILAAILGFISVQSYAYTEKLNVIADVGGESAMKYYEPITPETSNPKPAVTRNTLADKTFIPLVSTTWKQGYVEPKGHTLDTQGQSFFIIGDDEKSLKWLKNNLEALNALHAFGMVIQLKKPHNLEKIRAIVGNLSVMPNGDETGDLAKKLGINQYPVLVVPNYLATDLQELKKKLVRH